VPDIIWAPLATGAIVLIPGVVGLAAGRPWLFPSLGPTAYLQATQPQHPTSRFYNVLVGHLIGIGVAPLQARRILPREAERRTEFWPLFLLDPHFAEGYKCPYGK